MVSKELNDGFNSSVNRLYIALWKFLLFCMYNCVTVCNTLPTTERIGDLPTARTLFEETSNKLENVVIPGKSGGRQGSI